MLEDKVVPSMDDKDGGPDREERLLGAICYGPFGFVLPTLLQKQSNFLAFHTKQGAIIFVSWLILNFFPIPGLFGILTLVYVGLAGFAGWKAYNGEEYIYPFTQAILEKFKK